MGVMSLFVIFFFIICSGCYFVLDFIFFMVLVINVFMICFFVFEIFELEEEVIWVIIEEDEVIFCGIFLCLVVVLLLCLLSFLWRFVVMFFLVISVVMCCEEDWGFIMVDVVVSVMLVFNECMVKFVSRIMMDSIYFGVVVNICWNSYVNDKFMLCCWSFIMWCFFCIFSVCLCIFLMMNISVENVFDMV